MVKKKKATKAKPKKVDEFVYGATAYALFELMKRDGVKSVTLAYNGNTPKLTLAWAAEEPS